MSEDKLKEVEELADILAIRYRGHPDKYTNNQYFDLAKFIIDSGYRPQSTEMVPLNMGDIVNIIDHAMDDVAAEDRLPIRAAKEICAKFATPVLKESPEVEVINLTRVIAELPSWKFILHNYNHKHAQKMIEELLALASYRAAKGKT